jgi:hypothetical protein
VPLLSISEEKLAFCGHGSEIVGVGEAVAGKVANERFEVEHDAGGVVAEKVGLPDGDLDVVPAHRRVGVVLGIESSLRFRTA